MVAGINSVWAQAGIQLISDLGANSVTFNKDATLYVEFAANTNPQIYSPFQGADGLFFNNQGWQGTAGVVLLLKVQSTITINSTTNNRAGIHWQNSSNSWQHNGKEYARFFPGDGDVQLPFPTSVNQNCLVISVDAQNNASYSWKVYGGSPTPQPDPVGGDPRVEGCDGCFTVQ